MKNKIILMLLSCALPGFLYAATDGTIGPTSTGDISLSVTVNAPQEPQIEITGLEDFNWGNVAIGTDLPAITKSNICVRMTNAATYSISMEDSIWNLFEMRAGGGVLSTYYSVSFTDASGTSVGTSGGSGLQGSTAPTCSAAELASLTIDPIGGMIIDGGSPFTDQTYTGGIILTVTPD